MFKTFEEFAKAAEPYLSFCSQFAASHGLDQRIIVDHICFKCQSNLEYEQLRSVLERNPPSSYFYQVYLARRRVAYLGLREGMPTRVGGPVMCIELSDKKPGTEEVLGFHHVEIFPIVMSYQELVEKLTQEGENLTLKERPHHTTHDIILSNGFIIRLTDRPLIKKIVEEELSK